MHIKKLIKSLLRNFFWFYYLPKELRETIKKANEACRRSELKSKELDKLNLGLITEREFSSYCRGMDDVPY